MQLKKLNERLNQITESLNSIVDTVESEERAMTDAEMNEYDSLIDEKARTERTISAIKSKQSLEFNIKSGAIDTEDVKNFANFVRAQVTGEPLNSGTNMTQGDNGAIIPTSIVKKIVDRVRELSPIYDKATRYNTPGTLKVPYVDASVDDITVGYADEIATTDSHTPKTLSISLTGYLIKAVSKISKKLIQNTDFDITAWTVERVAKKMAFFIEQEAIKGTENKIKGILGSYDSTNMKVTTASKSAITSDELIDLQDLIPDIHSVDAWWMMTKGTRKKIRKLKDGEGQYILNRDLTAAFGYTLLGKPVYLTENLDELGNNDKNIIIYGDFSGLAIKEDGMYEISVLNERYADEGAVGIVAFDDVDAQIEDGQKLAVMVTPSAT